MKFGSDIHFIHLSFRMNCNNFGDHQTFHVVPIIWAKTFLIGIMNDKLLWLLNGLSNSNQIRWHMHISVTNNLQNYGWHYSNMKSGFNSMVVSLTHLTFSTVDPCTNFLILTFFLSPVISLWHFLSINPLLPSPESYLDKTFHRVFILIHFLWCPFLIHPQILSLSLSLSLSLPLSLSPPSPSLQRLIHSGGFPL